MLALIAKIRGFLYLIYFNHAKRNITVDKGLKVYKKLDIKGPGQVMIGKNCTVSGVRGDKSQFVTLYTHHPDARIYIGDNVKLFAARISCKFEITIGNHVLIEESGILDTDFHSIDKNRGFPIAENKEKCKVIIENHVSIGARSLITKSVKIGEESIICPGSIVVSSIPAHKVVFGNPALGFGGRWE